MRKGLTIALCTLVIITSNTWAITADHDAYLKAERLLNKRQYVAFQHAFKKLSDHPLAPYLEARWIRSQFHITPIAAVDSFINRYDQEQPALKLERQWLAYLAKKQKWRLFLSYYQPTSSHTLQCQRIQALENSKRQHEAINEGQALWLLGVSLPKACDKVYKAWERNGYLSQDLIWQRWLKAKPSKQYKLVRYLTRKLDKRHKAKAKLLSYYWRHPERVFTGEKALTMTAQERHIILAKALKKQPQLWLKQYGHDAFKGLDDDQHHNLLSIAVNASANQSPENIFEWYDLAKTHQLLSSDLQQTFLQGALSKQNWPLYTHLFKVANTDLKDKPKWQYWQGRALGSLGAPAEHSLLYYQKASVHRDFYGFLSSQKLGIGGTMNHTPTHVPASVIQRIRLTGGVKRALALLDLGRTPQARREWQTVFNKQTEEGKQAMAILAGRLEWSDRAIMSLAQIKSWHDLQLRFPLAHNKLFEKAAQKNHINKNWIYGIARQESAFMHDARSSVGATGLMQIMPNTAKGISKRMRIKYSRNRLVDPNYNIKLGGHYLQVLLKRYKGNRVLATAAYNAGPSNVNRWLKKNQGPIDIWIEQIPFKETKEYVKRVLAYSTIYSYRLGYLQPVLDDNTLSAWALLHPPELQISATKMEQNDNG